MLFLYEVAWLCRMNLLCFVVMVIRISVLVRVRCGSRAEVGLEVGHRQYFRGPCGPPKWSVLDPPKINRCEGRPLPIRKAKSASPTRPDQTNPNQTKYPPPHPPTQNGKIDNPTKQDRIGPGPMTVDQARPDQTGPKQAQEHKQEQSRARRN